MPRAETSKPALNASNPLLDRALSQHHAAVAPPPPLIPKSAPVAASPASPLGRMDLKGVIEAKKQAKNAASALDFDDVNTAVDCLRKALAALGQHA